jgi:DNA-binding GntR family transcriptional regulator
METLVKELRSAAKADDFQRALDAHLELHRLFYECSNNEVLMAMWKSWESQLRLFFAEDLQNLFDPEVSAQVHSKLVELIKTGDVEKIRQAVAEHVHGSTISPESKLH